MITFQHTLDDIDYTVVAFNIEEFSSRIEADFNVFDDDGVKKSISKNDAKAILEHIEEIVR